MSRTYRKRIDKHTSYEFNRVTRTVNIIASTKKDVAMHYSDNGYSYSMPKAYRKWVNKERRTRDKVELYKAVNLEDYEEQCSRWNCKDNNHWIYF